MISTNRQLRGDLDKELERFALLEGKYKELLVKFSRLAKDSAKYEHLLFTQTTGGNLDNFDKFLTSADAFGERPTTSATHAALNKNYSNVFGEHTS